jgi:hypothetical protein
MSGPQPEVKNGLRESLIIYVRQERFRGRGQTFAGRQPALNGWLMPGSGAQVLPVTSLGLQHCSREHLQRGSWGVWQLGHGQRRLVQVRHRRDDFREPRWSQDRRQVDCDLAVWPCGFRAWHWPPGLPAEGVVQTTAVLHHRRAIGSLGHFRSDR